MSYWLDEIIDEAYREALEKGSYESRVELDEPLYEDVSPSEYIDLATSEIPEIVREAVPSSLTCTMPQVDVATDGVEVALLCREPEEPENPWVRLKLTFIYDHETRYITLREVSAYIEEKPPTEDSEASL